MHILLPPSETKRSGGGFVRSPASLAHDERLAAARIAVRGALLELCGDADLAAKSLKLGVKNRAEIARNLELDRSGTMAAVDRYTGVLYDALDARSLDGESRDWLLSHVSIQSALFGLISAADRIPAYRLSAGSRLPSLGAPLKRVWQAAHAAIDWSAFGWVLDLRSKDYAALAPLPVGAGVPLQVAQRSEAGEVRALNHFNKAAKGDLVRRLARSGREVEQPHDLLAWAEVEGIELVADAETGTLTLLTELGAPTPGGTR